jgi:mRNA-degrading endonuclease RelE of RelBE toxin-antitoxin system
MTDKNIEEKKLLEKNNFIWRAEIKKYYRLIYEFDVE